MALQVFGDRILVTPREDEKTSSGGIVLPGASQKGYKIGVVKAVAPTRFEHGRHVNNEVRNGDIVYYDRATHLDDTTHLLSISNVLCFERSEDELDEEPDERKDEEDDDWGN